MIRFEDLKRDPISEYKKICKKFFPMKNVLNTIFGVKDLDVIDKKVGILPNKATINSWHDLFNKEDLEFFYNQIPDRKFLDEN